MFILLDIVLLFIYGLEDFFNVRILFIYGFFEVFWNGFFILFWFFNEFKKGLRDFRDIGVRKESGIVRCGEFIGEFIVEKLIFSL